MAALHLQTWLREQCAEFVFFPAGVYVEQGNHDWPLVADDAARLTDLLESGGHLVSLPKESAALANVIEVALVDFLLARLEAIPGASGRRGEERSYPDLEISGDAFGGGYHAVDIKMARLARSGRQTQVSSPGARHPPSDDGDAVTGLGSGGHLDLDWPVGQTGGDGASQCRFRDVEGQPQYKIITVAGEPFVGSDAHPGVACWPAAGRPFKSQAGAVGHTRGDFHGQLLAVFDPTAALAAPAIL